MAWVRHVWIDLLLLWGKISFAIIENVGRGLKRGGEGRKTHAAVSAIGAATLFRRLIDLYMLDDQVARVEAFGVRVGLGVFQQA